MPHSDRVKNATINPTAAAVSRPKTYRIGLEGDDGAGKSSLLLRYADGQFVTSFIHTIGIDFKHRHVMHRDTSTTVRLQVWDKPV